MRQSLWQATGNSAAFVRGWTTCGLPVIRTESMPRAGNTSYKPINRIIHIVDGGENTIAGIGDDPGAQLGADCAIPELD
jgi:hypothetical protein